MEIAYTRPTAKSYVDAIQAVRDAIAARGFRVQAIHDVAATLAEKGFDREPITLVEMCNAKYAAAVLEADIDIALMLPCPISIYEKAGEVFISTMRPSLIGAFFPDAGIEDTAGAVERILFEVVDEAAG